MVYGQIHCFGEGGRVVSFSLTFFHYKNKETNICRMFEKTMTNHQYLITIAKIRSSVSQKISPLFN